MASEEGEKDAPGVHGNAEYRAALEKAKQELFEAETAREKIDLRILRLKQTIATLFRLVGVDVPDAMANKGITDAVREYLRFMAEAGSGHPVGVAQVRDQLEIVGYDFSGYKNPNASIAGTLERLVATGEAKKVRAKNLSGKFVTGYTMRTVGKK